MVERRAHLSGSWVVVAAFASWALLQGWVESQSTGAVPAQPFVAEFLSDGVAGIVLLMWAFGRRQRAPGRRTWTALLLVIAIELSSIALRRPLVEGALHLPAVRTSQQSLIFMAGPLWLALLGALQWVPEATPRRTVGAGLAGVAAMALLLQEREFSLTWAAIPVLLLTVVQAIAVVWTWSYAKRALLGVSTAMAAGCGLLIAAALKSIIRITTEGSHWTASGIQAGSLGRRTGVEILSAVLWYWLLQRMELPAFSMQTQAYWLASILLQSALFGSLSWRLGIAVTLCMSALTIALRAKPDDDDPVALHVA